jgi:hypothetical protein
MKVIKTTKESKLLHARPGSCVRLYDMNGERILDELWLVAVLPDGKCDAALVCKSNGLYSDKRALFLVSIDTGELRALPHKSTRVQLVSTALVVETTAHEPVRFLPPQGEEPETSATK